MNTRVRESTLIPRGNKVVQRYIVGPLTVTQGTKYDDFVYTGNMGNTYKDDICPLIDFTVGKDERKGLEMYGEQYFDGINLHDDASYSWRRILRH